MEHLNTLVENHYHTPGLYEDILKRLGEQGVYQNSKCLIRIGRAPGQNRIYSGECA